METTAAYDALYEFCGDVKPINISLDPLTSVFCGSEIDRAQVSEFARIVRRLARVANGSATLLAHPSLQGLKSGSGISGSTAWHNAFRFRHYLSGVGREDMSEEERLEANDLRVLEFKKNQYGPLGTTLRLRWKAGLFVPVADENEADREAREGWIDDLFLELLVRLWGEGRWVSHKRRAENYAAGGVHRGGRGARAEGAQGGAGGGDAPFICERGYRGRGVRKTGTAVFSDKGEKVQESQGVRLSVPVRKEPARYRHAEPARTGPAQSRENCDGSMGCAERAGCVPVACRSVACWFSPSPWRTSTHWFAQRGVGLGLAGTGTKGQLLKPEGPPGSGAERARGAHRDRPSAIDRGAQRAQWAERDKCEPICPASAWTRAERAQRAHPCGPACPMGRARSIPGPSATKHSFAPSGTGPARLVVGPSAPSTINLRPG